MSADDTYVPDDGVVMPSIPPHIRGTVNDFVRRGGVYSMLAPFMPGKTCGLFLYCAAVEALLASDSRPGIRKLYSVVGKVFGKTPEAARRCMSYVKPFIAYEECNAALFKSGLSRKAFSYVTVPELISAAAAAAIEKICSAAVCEQTDGTESALPCGDTVRRGQAV